MTEWTKILPPEDDLVIYWHNGAMMIVDTCYVDCEPGVPVYLDRADSIDEAILKYEEWVMSLYQEDLEDYESIEEWLTLTCGMPGLDEPAVFEVVEE